ncbi:hypothetical protein, partial [Actinocorallia lasiicapitis]
MKIAFLVSGVADPLHERQDAVALADADALAADHEIEIISLVADAAPPGARVLADLSGPVPRLARPTRLTDAQL